jgi:putative copper export protein
VEDTFAPLATLARWMDMTGAALTLGVIAFAFTVWRPGAAQGLPVRDERFVRLLWAGWAAYGLGLALGFGVRPGASGSELVWAGRAILWIGFGAVLRVTASQPQRWRILAALGLGFAVLPSFISHAHDAGSADALINDMLHRVAAALWIGGLAGWAGALWGDGHTNVKATGKAVSRFSNLARFYVLLLAAGGLFAAIQYIPSSEALFDTGYGRALTIKGVLFALMFGLAGFNLLFAERRLKRGQESWVRVLRLTISAELTLGMALMLLSAVMAASVPARDVIATREPAGQTVVEPENAGQPDMQINGAITPSPAGDE